MRLIPGFGQAIRAAVLITGAAACGARTSAETSLPPASPSPAHAATGVDDVVAQTNFAPSLGVHLDQMLRRSSGLYVQDLQVGKGAVALRGTSMVVRYTGWLADGRQFDSGEITVTLGGKQTIAGWEEGLLGMRVGGKRRLVVPPNLGYGASGAGDIPPNAVLVFDIEMVGAV